MAPGSRVSGSVRPSTASRSGRARATPTGIVTLSRQTRPHQPGVSPDDGWVGIRCVLIRYAADSLDSDADRGARCALSPGRARDGTPAGSTSPPGVVPPALARRQSARASAARHRRAAGSACSPRSPGRRTACPVYENMLTSRGYEDHRSVRMGVQARRTSPSAYGRGACESRLREIFCGETTFDGLVGCDPWPSLNAEVVVFNIVFPEGNHPRTFRHSDSDASTDPAVREDGRSIPRAIDEFRAPKRPTRPRDGHRRDGFGPHSPG